MAEYIKHTGGSVSGKSKKPYDAMVYKDADSGYTIAVDGNGNVIKKVLSSANADEVVIQAAVDISPGAPNVVLIKSGTYYISDCVNLRSYVTIRGENRYTMLNATTSFNAFFLTSQAEQYDGIYIENLTFTDGSNQCGGVVIENLRYGHVFNCRFTTHYTAVGIRNNPGFYTWAVHVTEVSASVTGEYGVWLRASDCAIFNCSYLSAGGSSGTGLQGVRVEGSANRIEGNHIIGGTSSCLDIATGTKNAVIGNYFDNSASRGINLGTAANSNMIIGNFFYICDVGAIMCNGDYNTILGNSIEYCTKTAGYSEVVLQGATNNVVAGNVFNNSHVGAVRSAIREVSASDSNIICENNILTTTYTSPPIETLGSNTVVKNNIGYVTESTGTAATISAGNTYVDVTHGLASTPTKVRVTPTTNLGTRSFWVDTKGASTFRININSSDVIDHTFDWEAEV